MLNLDETLTTISSYNFQRDLFSKSFLFSFTVITFVDILRGQVAEVNLLQLIPIYLILLFISFLYLVFFSNLLTYLPLLMIVIGHSEQNKKINWNSRYY